MNESYNSTEKIHEVKYIIINIDELGQIRWYKWQSTICYIIIQGKKQYVTLKLNTTYNSIIHSHKVQIKTPSNDTNKF